MGSNHFSIRVVFSFYFVAYQFSRSNKQFRNSNLEFFNNSFKGIRLFFEGNSSNKENKSQRLVKGVSRTLG